MHRSRSLLIAIALLAAGPVLAQQTQTQLAAAAPPKDGQEGLSGAVAAGYAKTSGNSESSALNVKGDARYDDGRWHHFAGGTAIASSSASNRDEPEETTAESYWLGVKSQYDLGSRYYAFGSVDWYKDRFSAYDQQLYEAVGLGWRLLRGPEWFLDAELGVGAKQAELVSGESQDEFIQIARGILTWNISENATFVQKLAVLHGDENTYTESNTELKAGIIGNLALVLGYTIKHNSDVEVDTSLTPPRDFEKSDEYTTISLEYKF